MPGSFSPTFHRGGKIPCVRACDRYWCMNNIICITTMDFSINDPAAYVICYIYLIYVEKPTLALNIWKSTWLFKIVSSNFVQSEFSLHTHFKEPLLVVQYLGCRTASTFNYRVAFTAKAISMVTRLLAAMRRSRFSHIYVKKNRCSILIIIEQNKTLHYIYCINQW